MKDELRKSIFEMIANDSPGSEIIPNFSALARRIGVDRHTLSDHWRNGYPTYDPSKPRKSKFDGYTAEISDAYTKTSCVMAVFQYMRNKYPQVFTSYTAFKSFSDSRGLRPANVKVPHVRFETEEGFQVQVDWKEDMKMILKDGTVIEFNIFVLTFSSSRMHYFEFSIHKTFEEICRCFLAVFQRAGGVPRSMLTDNMATLLDYDKEDFTAEAKQFFKDVGFEPTRCKKGHPYTKGKVESPNRFMKWLAPYQNELESIDDLIETLAVIETAVNREKNRTTGIPPATLFAFEKEALGPLPKKDIIDRYMHEKTITIRDTLLFQYDDTGYSMPEDCIGKKLRVSECNGWLYIYDGANLLRAYSKQKPKSINYTESEYVGALEKAMPDKPIDEINAQARKNLELLSRLGDQYEEKAKNE